MSRGTETSAVLNRGERCLQRGIPPHLPCLLAHSMALLPDPQLNHLPCLRPPSGAGLPAGWQARVQGPAEARSTVWAQVGGAGGGQAQVCDGELSLLLLPSFLSSVCFAAKHVLADSLCHSAWLPAP